MNYAVGILSAPSGVRRVIVSDGWCMAPIEVRVETQFWMVVESVAGFFCNESCRASVEYIGVLMIEGLGGDFFNNSSGCVAESFL